jgi:5'-nucleotidase
MNMHILVTNDDGVNANGLLVLAQEMRKLGEVTVLAPDRNWSGSGHVKTILRPLRVKSTTLADGTPALASDGAPSDCVALALLGLAPNPVDLVISGINPYANFGGVITYSGTVTAAMEAVINSVPGIAFSLNTPRDHQGPRDYATAAHFASVIAKQVLHHGLPPNTLLNVNVPYRAVEEVKGIRITRQGLRYYQGELVAREDPRGHPYYWFSGKPPTSLPEDGTDYGALEAGYVSITPLQLDFTDYEAFERLSQWEWKNS